MSLIRYRWLTVVNVFARGDSFKRHSLERTQSRVTTWLIDSHGMEAWNKGRPSAVMEGFTLDSQISDTQ